MKPRWGILTAIIALVFLLVQSVAAGGPPADPPGLAQAIAVQDAHTERLLATPGVVGTGVGLGHDGGAVIRIFPLPAGVADTPGTTGGESAGWTSLTRGVGEASCLASAEEPAHAARPANTKSPSHP